MHRRDGSNKRRGKRHAGYSGRSNTHPAELAEGGNIESGKEVIF